MVNPDKDIFIEEYLVELKQLVHDGSFDIEIDRQKNKNFIQKYHLRTKDIKNILLDLKTEDFVERVPTQDYKYNSEYLYVFKKNLLLDDIECEDDDSESEVEIKVYIKTSIPEGNRYKIMIVVSLHEDEI